MNTAVEAANDAAAHGGGVVIVAYPNADPWPTILDRITDDGEPGSGKPAISVDPATRPVIAGDGGAAVVLQHAGPGVDPDDPVDDLTNNFVQGPGLGDFVHEKYISGLDTTTTGAGDENDYNNQRIILFTDIEQAGAAIPASTVNFNRQGGE